MRELANSDVLTYSSTTTSIDPLAYRIVTPLGRSLPAIARRAPELMTRLVEAPPLVVLMYPATLGLTGLGPTIDTYLVPAVGSRALALAAAVGRDALVASTPLLAARLLTAHMTGRRAWPRRMLLALGGYPLPLSLETAFRSWGAEHGCQVSVLQFFGQAEVDAACLFALGRDSHGRVLYHPRDGVELVLGATNLGLRLHVEGAVHWLDCQAEATANGLVLEEPRRWAPQVLAELEAWSERDWRRRSGFLQMSRPPRLQLREGIAPIDLSEVLFHVFAEATAMEWHKKPDWAVAS